MIRSMPVPHRLAGGVVLGAAIAAALTMQGTSAPATAADVSALWRDPGDVAARDLRWGRGGPALVPRPDVEYEFNAIDATGYSAGYDVTDPDGRQWDVKTGDEAQTEVVASRLLWAVGFHQPVVYYVPEWRMKNGPVTTPFAGRFRLSSDHLTIGEWSWTDHRLKDARPFKGLVIANLLINNWDLKPSNNRHYEVRTPRGPEQWFVAQDIGASFGRTGWPVGNRNSVADYESQRFIVGVERGRVQFDYQARHRELLENITPDDVVWTCRLFDRLTDRQWNDAFAAALWPDDTRDRYIRKIKSKIDEGLALQADTTR